MNFGGHQGFENDLNIMSKIFETHCDAQNVEIVVI
jgi:hypothetical protein